MDQRLATVTSAGTVYWHHTDHLGSVIATSDANGQTVGVATYSPHGEGAPPLHSPFGFTGRQYDPETGLYYYRARYYSPYVGQFLTTDPIGTKDDPNLYAYVGLDSANATDPTGLASLCAATAGRVSGRVCIKVDGDGNGTAEPDDLTRDQIRRLERSFAGFIRQHGTTGGRDISGFGRRVTEGDQWAPEGAADMLRAVSQVVGYAANQAGGEFARKWAGVGGIQLNRNRAFGFAAAGLSDSNHILFLASFSSRNYSNPSLLGRIMIHESLHYEQPTNLLYGIYFKIRGHRNLDARACGYFVNAGLNGSNSNYGASGYGSC
jgi:RHS repeat-associated protein